jgi:hypothetical protein
VNLEETGNGLCLQHSAKGFQKKDAFALLADKTTPSATAPAQPNTTNTNTQSAMDCSTQESWPTPTVQEAGKIGNQANNGQLALSNHPAIRGECTREKFEKGKHGPASPANPSTNGSRLESWSTPKASDPQHSGPNMRDSAGNYALPAQAVRESWATPQSRDFKGAQGRSYKDQSKDLPMMTENKRITQTGKLNPRWVETLMGLPVGWTMPSCASPVTIELTS